MDFQHFACSTYGRYGAQTLPWCCWEDSSATEHSLQRASFGVFLPRWKAADWCCWFPQGQECCENEVQQSLWQPMLWQCWCPVAKSKDVQWPQAVFSFVPADRGLVLCLVPLKMLGKCSESVFWLDPRKTSKMFATRANSPGNCCPGLDSLESQQLPS